jgi:hypothetical protein
MAASSKPRPSLVTKLEPTLTTMRLALNKSEGFILEDKLTSSRRNIYLNSYYFYSNYETNREKLFRNLDKSRIDVLGRLLRDLLGFDVFIDGLDQRLATFTGQG